MIPAEWEAKFSFIDYEPRRKYAAMVAYMDDVVGRLVDAVKAKGMWDNTLIWFMSDNGGELFRCAGSMYFFLRISLTNPRGS